jgi:hypothetical protein
MSVGDLCCTLKRDLDDEKSALNKDDHAGHLRDRHNGSQDAEDREDVAPRDRHRRQQVVQGVGDGEGMRQLLNL